MNNERQIVLHNLTTVFPDTEEGWKIELITTGLTNHLYLCSTNNNYSCMYRVFGANTELIIDRKKELQLLRCLGDAGLAAKVLATFSNALVYEYIQGQTLKLEESIIFQAEIAAVLAQFHNHASQVMQFTRTSSDLMFFQLLHKCLQLLPPDVQQEYTPYIIPVDCAANTPVVFSHNDLLPGNIIRTPAGEFKFIDFEYAGWNYAAFDIANHLCEDIGIDVFPERLPSDQRIANFLSIYNQHTEQSVTLSDVKYFIPLNHLLWAVWARVQAMHSRIDFDYLSYSRKRFQLFFKTR